MEKPVKIYIGTPCYGGQCFAGYLYSLIQSINYLRNTRITIDPYFLNNESLITRGRNTIVAKFLANSSFTHLLFIDADIIWHPSSIEKLVNADVDIVGAIYPKKGYNWKNLEKVLPNLVEYKDGKLDFKTIDTKMEDFIKANLMDYTINYGTSNNIEKNLLEVRHIGTGFMLIKREALEKMCSKFPECKYDDDVGNLSVEENKHLYSLFDCDISTESDNKLHYLSEDFLFCKRWISIGGKIHAELTSMLTHTGTHQFRGNYLASLRFGSGTTTLEKPLVLQQEPQEFISETQIVRPRKKSAFNFSNLILYLKDFKYPIVIVIIAYLYR